MRTIVVKGLLMLALCMMAIPAMTQQPDKSDIYVAHLGNKILDRIHENEALEKNGAGDQARYLILDGPAEDNPNWFYYDFTSQNAIQLWEKRGWVKEATMGMDMSAEAGNLNKWINELRENYLSNTKYKDQKIYFVVSGIYNYDNIDEPDRHYDWAELRSVSFDSEVKDKTATGFSDKESAIVNKILSKVKNSGGNAELKNIVDNGSYIICFIFNLFKSFPSTQIITEHVVADNALASSGLRTREVFVSKPKTFLIDGYFFSAGADPDIIKNVQTYVTSHTTNDDATANATTANRNNYLSEFIRNVFLSFNPVTTSTTCATDKQLMDKLEALYSKGLSDGTYDVSASLKELSLDTRKCLLKQLSNTTFCTDANNWVLRLGACENLIVDLVKSTPVDQRRQLLDYFNDKETVLKELIGKLHDEGPGTENFTTFILTLSEYAYEQYANDYSSLFSASGYCSFLSYDPTKDFNTYSKTILADYNNDNSISFEFRNYDGPCYTQTMDAQGYVTYESAKRSLKPFAFIGVIPLIDLPVKFSSGGSAQSTIGKKLFVPAVMLYWNVKRNNTREIVRKLELSANAIGFFMGLGEVQLTGTVLGRILLAAEGATTFANMVVNSPAVQTAILKKEGGAEFIETIGTINNFSGVATIGYLGLAKFGRAVKFWKTYKADFTATGIMDFERIGARMNDLESALVKDGLIYTKGATLLDRLEELFKAIKKNLLKRLEVEKDMKLRYTDNELRTIIKNGDDLNLPAQEIEDVIFNGCRNNKDFDAASIIEQIKYWNKVKIRGYPTGFNSIPELEEFTRIIKEVATAWGLPAEKLFFQGSALRVGDKLLISDFDLAFKTDEAAFSSYFERFKNATTSKGRTTTIVAEGARGKISGGNMFLNLETKGSFKRVVMDKLEQHYGKSFTDHFGIKDMQLSIIKEGSPLDVSPYILLK